LLDPTRKSKHARNQTVTNDGHTEDVIASGLWKVCFY